VNERPIPFGVAAARLGNGDYVLAQPVARPNPSVVVLAFVRRDGSTIRLYLTNTAPDRERAQASWTEAP
jgi:hypothetical protein